jgi:hypothetical protein
LPFARSRRSHRLGGRYAVVGSYEVENIATNRNSLNF